MSDKKLAIADALQNLSKEDYDKFCMFLVDGHRGRRVPLSKVQGKDILEVTNVLVNFFTEDKALVVTSELLTRISSLQQAKELKEESEDSSSVLEHDSTCEEEDDGDEDDDGGGVEAV